MPRLQHQIRRRMASPLHYADPRAMQGIAPTIFQAGIAPTIFRDAGRLGTRTTGDLGLRSPGEVLREAAYLVG